MGAAVFILVNPIHFFLFFLRTIPACDASRIDVNIIKKLQFRSTIEWWRIQPKNEEHGQLTVRR